MSTRTKRNLDTLKRQAQELDHFAETERDILAHMLRVGMAVPTREWARIGRIQIQAENAWLEYKNAGGTVAAVDGWLAEVAL